MTLTLGIALFSIALTAFAVESVDLQYHSVNFKEIEWAQIKTLRVDSVTLRVFLDIPTEGGLYFNNRQFRVIEDRVTDHFIPPLNDRDGKPRIVGWLIARKYGWIEKKDWFDMNYISGTRERVDKIDLFNPEAVDAVLATFVDLARTGVHGILIQDDLILRHIEGFSNWGKAAYTVQTGIPADPDMMQTAGTVEQQNWNRVKLNQVNQIVRRIVKACKEVNPAIRVAMNVYYETPLKTEHGESWYAHNLYELMQTGLDEIALMAYHRQMAQEWGLEIGSTVFLDRFKSMIDRAQAICAERLRVKFQIRDWNSGELLPTEELTAFLNSAAKTPQKITLTPVRPGDLNWIQALLSQLKRRDH